MLKEVVDFIYAFLNNWPHWTGHDPYKPIHRALLEQLIRHLLASEDGSHLPKHVRVESGTY
jgi:hypothetical protein